MNYKRKKPRGKVRCWLCTDARGYGNSLASGIGSGRVQASKIVARISEKEQLKSITS